MQKFIIRYVQILENVEAITFSVDWLSFRQLILLDYQDKLQMADYKRHNSGIVLTAQSISLWIS